MPTTSNFGWTTPADTDLVKDGAAAIRTLGNGVDSSFVDLKGGTSGQILSKNSNTDLDFVWIANDQGDITAVTAGTGISGGGTSGAVTITNSMATEITASGDIIVGTGSSTFDNLPIGSTGQVLTADTTVSPYKVKWAAVSSGGSTWTTFTPTLTNMTLGNGTSTWKYSEVGELVFIIGKIEWGSTTSLSGGFDVGGLPFNINSDYAAENPLGFMQLRDTGTQFYIGGVHQFIGNATKIDPVTIITSGTYAVQGGINATTPFTWTTNDVMGFWFSYRKA